MKKALALILAVVMCIGMASVAFAIDVDYDIHHFTILGRIKISRPMLGMTRNIVKMEISGPQSRFFFAQRIPKGIAIRQAAAREVTLKSM